MRLLIILIFIKYDGIKSPKCDGFIGFPFDQVIETNNNYESDKFCIYDVSNNKKNGKKRLSTSEIIGITAGCVVFISIVLIIINNKKKENQLLNEIDQPFDVGIPEKC